MYSSALSIAAMCSARVVLERSVPLSSWTGSMPQSASASFAARGPGSLSIASRSLFLKSAPLLLPVVTMKASSFEWSYT